MFDRRNGNQLVGTVAGLTKSVFTLDWYQHRYLAIAGGDAAVRIFEVGCPWGPGWGVGGGC